MTALIPYEATAPTFRVKTAVRWQNAETAWVEQPAQKANGTGLRVRSFSRMCLPQIGAAIITYEYGVIDDVTYSPDQMQVGRGYEIRIERNRGTEEAPVWYVEWWGEVIAIRRLPSPGAEVPQGALEIHCRDGLHRTTRWKMDRHQVYEGSVAFGDKNDRGCYGHPGYNLSDGLRVIGNREGSGADGLGIGYLSHAAAGASGALTWTDAQALTNAIKSSTPATFSAEGPRYFHPLFTVAGSTNLLNVVNVWPINPDSTLMQFLVRIFDRRRGRGNAYLDWTQTGDQIVPVIRLIPPTLADINETLPSGATYFASGAASGLIQRSIDVDLVGDHRLVDERFELSDAFDTQYDSVEVIGEPIRVMVTLSQADGSLQAGWGLGERIAFEDGGLDDELGVDVAKYSRVFRSILIPPAWNGKAGNGAGGGSLNCMFQVADNGSITTATDGAPFYSPALLRLDNELPIIAGYDYTTNPPTQIQTGAIESAPMPIQVYQKVGAAPVFIDIRQVERIGISRGGPAGLELIIGTDEDAGRFFDNYPIATIAITVSLTTPNHLRMQKTRPGAFSTDPNRNRKTIRASGLALHIAFDSAIWSLDPATEDAVLPGMTPRRKAANPAGLYGLLRDDRDQIAQLLILASQWYLTDRKTVSWAIGACGTGGAWTDLEGAEHAWPALGDVVNNFAYDGDTVLIDGPITSVLYDADEDITSWVTGFGDFDWAE